MHKILAFIMISLLLLSLPLQIIQVRASNDPGINAVKASVQKAHNYILALRQQLGIGDVYSEYPALPVVVHDPDLNVYGEYRDVWFIPGWDEPSNNPYRAVIRDSSIQTTEYSDHIATEYSYYIDLYLPGRDPLKVATLKVVEWRTYYYNTGQYTSHVRIEITYINSATDIQDADIYVGIQYVGKVGEASAFELDIPTVLPSMRTSIRHVDALAALVLDVLGETQLAYEVAQAYESAINSAWENNPPSTRVYIGYHAFPIYDIYLPMFTFLEYMTNIDEPNSNHFWDAKHFSYGVGYDRFRDLFLSSGYVDTVYPTYPYRSKLVSFARETGQDGGAAFLSYVQNINDPLYWGWMGLYYMSQYRYNDALEIWNNYILPHWDGTGIYVSNQNAYSTVRLAVAVTLGTLLAGANKISWDVVDDMVNVLLQLQWNGIGHYAVDGSTIYKIVKPDHIGGFLVSYDEVGSYGFVPFRPQLLENVLQTVVPASPPEYLGPVPTNSETTLLAMTALIQYAYWRYDIYPPMLLE